VISSRGSFEETLKAAAWETGWDATARDETAAYAELGRAARRCAYKVFAMDTFTREKQCGASNSRLWTSGTSLAVLQQLRACGSTMADELRRCAAELARSDAGGAAWGEGGAPVDAQGDDGAVAGPRIISHRISRNDSPDESSDEYPDMPPITPPITPPVAPPAAGDAAPRSRLAVFEAMSLAEEIAISAAPQEIAISAAPRPPRAAVNGCAERADGAAPPSSRHRSVVAGAAARLQHALQEYMHDAFSRTHAGSDEGALADASQLVAFAHLALTTAAHVQEMVEATEQLLALRPEARRAREQGCAATAADGTRTRDGEGARDLV